MIFPNKVEIVESKGGKSLRLYSKGVIVYKDIVEAQNALCYTILVTRVGKHGKRRIELKTFITEVFPITKMPDEALPILKKAGVLFPNDFINGAVKVTPEKHKNIKDIKTSDFVAYIVAFSSFINKIIRRSNGMFVCDDGENMLADVLMNANVEDLGPYIMGAYWYDTHNKSNTLLNIVDGVFNDVDNRAEIMKRVYKRISSLSLAISKYNQANAVRQASVRSKLRRILAKHDINAAILKEN